MNNLNRDGSFFTAGFICGVFSLTAILFIFGLNPSEVNKKWEKDAINRGFGQYVVDIEKKEVKFVWKQDEKRP